MENTKPTIGFIGQGYIGKNYADDFERRGYSVVRYSLEEPYVLNRPELARCDIIFIAVPTPTTPQGFDDSIVRDAIALAPAGSVVVIKSTMLPGTTERLAALFPEKFVVYSPEFLCVATAAHDAANPFMNVIGIPKNTIVHRAIADQILRILPKAPYEDVCHSTQAEMIKYTHNTLGYVKVVWVNMLYDVLQKFNMDWTPVRRAMEHDPMISDYYNDPIHKSGRGAGGGCFIKDYAAFAELYRTLLPNDATGRKVLDAIETKNVELLTGTLKDLDLLNGVYGMKNTIPEKRDTTPSTLPGEVPAMPSSPSPKRHGFGRAVE